MYFSLLASSDLLLCGRFSSCACLLHEQNFISNKTTASASCIVNEPIVIQATQPIYQTSILERTIDQKCDFLKFNKRHREILSLPFLLQCHPSKRHMDTHGCSFLFFSTNWSRAALLHCTFVCLPSFPK